MTCVLAARAISRWRWISRWCALLALLGAGRTAAAGDQELGPPQESTSAATISMFDAVRVMGSFAWWGVDLAMEATGYGGCPFADDPVQAAVQALHENIQAQPIAIESLTKALSAWHFGQRSGRQEPLVLALTGSTGTGKTETAYVLANAMLTKRYRTKGAAKDEPRGLLVLNGGQYTIAASVEKYQKDIQKGLGELLQYCGGNVVVLFDELQKVAPGTLDGVACNGNVHAATALMEAMSEHPRVTFDNGRRSVSVDSSRVIFLLVSDIGADSVEKAVLRYRRRADVVPGTLQTAVKKALDDQWERLRFGKMVDKVIPYLPMDPASNLLVIELKLRALAKTLPGGLFTTAELRWHLVQPRYIQYSTYHVKLEVAGEQETIRHDLALYGARDTEKESIRRIESTLNRHVLQPMCSTTKQDTSKSGANGVEPGTAGVRKGGERCWDGASVVDIRYDLSTDEVAFHQCAQGYAASLTDFQREQPSAVQTPHCELAWRGVLHDHGSFS